MLPVINVVIRNVDDMWWKNRFKNWEMFLQIIEEMMNQDMFTDREYVEPNPDKEEKVANDLTTRV